MSVRGLELLWDGFIEGTLILPREEIPNLVDLARAVARLNGVDMPHTHSSADIAEAIGDAESVVLVLADGCGMNMIESLPRGAFLPSHVHSDLLTVFPSSTAVALTTLTTAQWPSAHGITGWWTHLPDLGAAATILQYTARNGGGNLLERGIDPRRSFPVESVWAKFERDTLVVAPNHIRNSVYSNYFNGGRASMGYGSISDGVDKAIRHALGGDAPTFTYLYVPNVDSLAHIHGASGPETRRALGELDGEIARLSLAVGSRARVVVTADHGLLDAPARNRHTLRATRQLQPLLRRAPSGDARLLYMHTWDWAHTRFSGYIDRRFGERFMTLESADAIQLGLFGPDPPPEYLRERFGDQIALSRGADMIEYNAGRGQGRMSQLNCHHSGLTPDEMRIPLIIA